MLGIFHIACSVIALVLGCVVFLYSKGGVHHRILGYFYLASLFVVNISALSIYEESSNGGPFHILAVMSIATLLSGFIPVLTHKPRTSWLRLHAYFMCWSYIGLLAAGVGQFATMVFDQSAVITVALPSILIVIIGAYWIHKNVPKILMRISP